MLHNSLLALGLAGQLIIFVLLVLLHRKVKAGRMLQEQLRQLHQQAVLGLSQQLTGLVARHNQGPLLSPVFPVTSFAHALELARHGLGFYYDGRFSLEELRDLQQALATYYGLANQPQP